MEQLPSCPWPVEDFSPLSTTTSVIGSWQPSCYQRKFYGDLLPNSSDLVRKSNKLYGIVLNQQMPFCEDLVKPNASYSSTKIQKDLRCISTGISALPSHQRTDLISLKPTANLSRDRMRELDWRCFGVRHHRQKLRQLTFIPSLERTDRRFETEYQVASPTNIYGSKPDRAVESTPALLVTENEDKFCFSKDAGEMTQVAQRTDKLVDNVKSKLLCLDLSFLKSSAIPRDAPAIEPEAGFGNNPNRRKIEICSSTVKKNVPQIVQFGFLLPSMQN